jgi:hypothetical protein
VTDDDFDFLSGLVPTLQASYPSSPRLETFGQWTVVRIHRAALGHYLGVVRLVEVHLGVQASILLRSLYWETIRLGYFALEPQKLEELSLRLTHHSVRGELELQREAQRVFGGDPERFEIADLEKHLRDLETQLASIGVTKVKRHASLQKRDSWEGACLPTTGGCLPEAQ